jgi:hypothetical protein
MTSHVSASVREATPHVNKTTRTNTIINALKRRAQAVLNDTSIDPQQRAIIRYALEINDPWLAKLVRQADAGESFADTLDLSETPEHEEDDATEERIEALVEMICRAGDEPETKSAALLVLMATLEYSTQPKTLANTTKHLALTRYGELNTYGIVESQVAVVERQLFADYAPVS